MKAWKLAFLMILSINIAFAAVGWCGNIWPNSDSDQPLDSPIDVYFQIWKDGVTDSTGRGEGLAATIYWKEASSVVWDEIEMTYNGDVGNNDEYTGTIPAPSSVGDINYYCEVFDSTDTSTATGSDQNSVPLDESSPGVLHIVDVTSIDVTVTFQLDMTLEEITGDVTVGGSFNSWSSTENVLTDPDMDDVYVAEILFPAGSNPHQEYKFINSETWESIANRLFIIDDSAPSQILPVAFFNDRDPADYTDMEITVTFSVDMSGETVTTPYIAGSIFPLRWGWDAGWSDTLMLFDDGAHGDGSPGDGIYGANIVFPAMSYRDVEYKYTTDGSDNEPLPAFENHQFSLGDSLAQVLPMDTFGVITGIDDFKRPGAFDVSIYPNPFNSAVRIEVFLSGQTELRAEVFDIGGRRVSTLFNGQAPMGTIELNWISETSSGIYLLRVDTPKQTRIDKLFLIR